MKMEESKWNRRCFVISANRPQDVPDVRETVAFAENSQQTAQLQDELTGR